MSYVGSFGQRQTTPADMSNTLSLRARYEQMSQAAASDSSNKPAVKASYSQAAVNRRTTLNTNGQPAERTQHPPVVSSFSRGPVNSNANSSVAKAAAAFNSIAKEDEGANRSRPIQKPKVNPTRATAVFQPQQVQKAFNTMSLNEQGKNTYGTKGTYGTQSNNSAPKTTAPPPPTPKYSAAPVKVAPPPPSTPPPAPTPAPAPVAAPVPRAPTVSQPSAAYANLEIADKWKIDYDNLEFDEMVSEGSAGSVYLGYYFGTPVAIKKLFALADNQKHLVAREFAMLTGVNHPNIVQFLGICDHSTGIYLITEYIEHGDLFDLLVFSGQPLDWKTKGKISLQIAQACYYLHGKNIIHRDLKSQNVLIGEGQKVKLCDLGLATVVENNKRMTICGTNEWMAPEITMEDVYDEKVDVFSFGIVMVELINQRPPPRRRIDERLAFDVKGFLSTIPEDTPRELAQLVVDCCKFSSKERPSFKEIVPRLRNLVNNLPDPDE
ncbi:LISK family protein kinase [Planoprotostelium fungivorum]|uniref:non-specific serine/threonine protein kinase n=1 Tax=Planoprotostelium fungivorum TaxID=1890364 RepID=A0A2P6P0R1_9EUKA|nr:LISK family protein kinase [Planoprotostelium fungivorum]